MHWFTSKCFLKNTFWFIQLGNTRNVWVECLMKCFVFNFSFSSKPVYLNRSRNCYNASCSMQLESVRHFHSLYPCSLLDCKTFVIKMAWVQIIRTQRFWNCQPFETTSEFWVEVLARHSSYAPELVFWNRCCFAIEEPRSAILAHTLRPISAAERLQFRNICEAAWLLHCAVLTVEYRPDFKVVVLGCVSNEPKFQMKRETAWSRVLERELSAREV